MARSRPPGERAIFPVPNAQQRLEDQLTMRQKKLAVLWTHRADGKTTRSAGALVCGRRHQTRSAVIPLYQEGGHIRGRLADGGVSLVLKESIARYLGVCGFRREAPNRDGRYFIFQCSAMRSASSLDPRTLPSLSSDLNLSRVLS